MEKEQIVLSRRQVGRAKRMIESGATIIVRTEERKAQLEALGAKSVVVLIRPIEILGSLAQMENFSTTPNP